MNEWNGSSKTLGTPKFTTHKTIHTIQIHLHSVQRKKAKWTDLLICITQGLSKSKSEVVSSCRTVRAYVADNSFIIKS
jgi:hypothetical protein